MVIDNNAEYPHETHIFPENGTHLHIASFDCPCKPVPEIEQDEDGKETVFAFHRELDIYEHRRNRTQ